MTKEDTPLPLLSDDIAFGDSSPAHDNSPHDVRLVNFMRDFYEHHILSRDAKIKSLENEVTRLHGATNFETVPKEAYDRLEGLVQELRTSLERLTIMGVPMTHNSREGKWYPGNVCDQADAALSSAKALDFEPKTTT